MLLENVQGIDIALGSGRDKKKRRGRPRKSYASRIRDALKEHGYYVQQGLIKAVEFGVPQLRPRFFSLGIRKDLFEKNATPDFFQILRDNRDSFLRERNLPSDRPVTVAEAISDLEMSGKTLVDCTDSESPKGFKEIVYTKPITNFQKLMHEGLNGYHLNSLRLVNHRKATILRFKEILRTCRKGVQLSDIDEREIGDKEECNCSTFSRTAIAHSHNPSRRFITLF